MREAHAQLDLVFARRGERTVLGRRLFRWPFVLTRTFALDRVPAHMLTVTLQTSSGAMHGGDRLHQQFHVQGGAAAHVTTQGASSIHRADPGLTTEERVTITVEEGGYMEYLPEPRILFPGAALDQTIEMTAPPAVSRWSRTPSRSTIPREGGAASGGSPRPRFCAVLGRIP